MASNPKSAPQLRLQPTLVHLTLTMVPPSKQDSSFHRWPGCMVCGRLGGLSSLASAPAAVSTDQVFLVSCSPPLRAKPLRRGAALTGSRGNHLSVATANLAADLHLACEPCILLASLRPTTADLTLISAFVFVCAPPTSQAIGGRHCS